MAIKQLSDGGDEGTTLGQSATDLVGFHGAAPSDQAAAVTNIGDAATGAQIATAVNGILAALREKGLIAS